MLHETRVHEKDAPAIQIENPFFFDFSGAKLQKETGMAF